MKIEKLFLPLRVVALCLCALLLLTSCENEDGTCKIHKWGEWDTVATATCGTAGIEKRICQKCESEDTKISQPSGEHHFVNDQCSECRMMNAVVPMMIEREAFETKLQTPLKEALSTRDYAVFNSYFSLKEQGSKDVAKDYPITEKKGIDIYVYNDDPTDIETLRKLEAFILEHTDYSFDELIKDHTFVEYQPLE